MLYRMTPESCLLVLFRVCCLKNSLYPSYNWLHVLYTDVILLSVCVWKERPATIGLIFKLSIFLVCSTYLDMIYIIVANVFVKGVYNFFLAFIFR